MKIKMSIVLLILIFSISLVSASQITTDRLNWYESESHTVTIINTEGSVQTATLSIPTGFSFDSSTSGCTNPSGQTVSCAGIGDDGSAEFIMSSPVNGTEYELYVLSGSIGATTLNNVSFINIRDDEIFNTLVEYGRGRGNYFYNSMGSAGSSGMGTGYRYVPNSTDFELNYLHKVFNIKQYYGLAGESMATDVTFTCDYPVHTVIRQHLTETIQKGENEWVVSYGILRIDGSWERMGFLGMVIDSGEYTVGDNMTINCTNLNYSLDDVYGNVVVDESSFYLQIRDPEPVSITSSSNTATIGNGTTEVLITYTLTNDEVYPLDNVLIEIDSPELAQFIGVRGEIWGSARDKYVYKLTEMEAGQTEVLNLIARFDTSESSDTTLDLSQGVKVKFTPTWEINAYNPLEYIQYLTVSDTLIVDYGFDATMSIFWNINSSEWYDNVEFSPTSILETTSFSSTFTILQSPPFEGGYIIEYNIYDEDNVLVDSQEFEVSGAVGDYEIEIYPDVDLSGSEEDFTLQVEFSVLDDENDYQSLGNELLGTLTVVALTSNAPKPQVLTPGGVVSEPQDAIVGQITSDLWSGIEKHKNWLYLIGGIASTIILLILLFGRGKKAPKRQKVREKVIAPQYRADDD